MQINKKVILCLWLCVSLISCQCSNPVGHEELADTPENRAQLAGKYFELVPMHTMMKDMGQEIATRMPVDAREKFLNYWQEFATEDHMQEIESVAKTSLAKHMTTAELAAFIDFMQNPAGKSAMDKMKYYMADIMPLIQKQSMMAIQKFQTESTPTESK